MPANGTAPEIMPLPENPLVSVIIPSYNSRRWIARAIDSVMAQTYKNIEIIVVDDGSADETREFIRENYGSNDRVRYLFQPNSGVSRARNQGIEQAKGDLISFLDADDWLLPEKVARQVEFLRAHPEYQIAYCDFWNAYDREGPLEVPTGGWLIKGVSGQILPDLLARTVVIMHATLVRRECLEKGGSFREDLPYAEDWEFWMRLAGLGYQFGFLPDRDIVYYIRRGSRSTDNYRVQLCRNRICRYISEEIDPVVLQKALRASGVEATFQFGLARAYFEQKRNRAGLKQTFIALKTGRASHRLVYIMFCLGYLAALPFLGYTRLERFVMWLVGKLRIKI
jgi:glycosyltransferase involved in cell wall biosynthesis